MPRTDAELTRIFQHRPELAAVTSLDLLERLLAAPELAIPALLTLDADCHLVSQALQALGGRAGREALAGLLHDPGDRLGEAIGTLAAWGLVTLDGDTVVSPHEQGLWAHPFGLGRPLADFEREVSAEVLKSMVKALGGEPKGRKSDLIAQAVALLGDGEAVRGRAARLPRPAVTLLESMATGQPIFGRDGWNTSTEWVEQLVKAGFVIRAGWDYELPREVALALRGDAWRPALTGQPDVPGTPLPASDGLAAALAAVDRVVALTELAGQPITELKASGVGARELKRVARTLGVPEPGAVLWLDLAFGAELIASELGAELLATTRADAWLALPPHARWQALADSWHALPHAPTHRIVGCCADHMTAQTPPYPFECAAGDVRRATLRVLQTLPAGLGSDAEGLRPAVDWRTQSTRDCVPAATGFVAAALREGELLGLVQGGALTELGRAWLGGGDVAGRFPEPSRSATLQHDLTAIVAGMPAPELGAFLNGCADLESRDRASVWRFSEASVRRALDAGATTEDLLGELARVCAKAVPQPLRYLITDVARRHGAIRVAATASVVTSDDPALITELCGTRALRRLALRPIAPTVALSALPPDETLALLRQTGHAPVGVGQDGTIRAERAEPRRLPVESDPGPVIDAETAAKAILKGGDRPAGGTTDEVLRMAAMTGEPVVILWQRREHYLDDLELLPGAVAGYCHDCDTSHTFQRSRIKKAYLP
ncbi:helicase-associated domain-containing protein [Nonomuraea sp. NPDC002799]